MLLKLDPQVCSSRRLLSAALRTYAGHLPPESRFPSESILRREFGISRMTLNRALNDLVEEGILYRRCGAGRFVAEKELSRIYFVLPSLEKRRGESEGKFFNALLEEVKYLAQERKLAMTPLVASLTNRRNELDLEVFRQLPDGSSVILPGYWYSGLFDLLRIKRCKVCFVAIQATFDFLYQEKVSQWFRLEYDLSGAVELAMKNLRRKNIRRAVLIDDDNHCLSPYQQGLKRALKEDFLPELVIYGAKEGDFGGNVLANVLRAREYYPFDGIIAASGNIARKAKEVLSALNLQMPLVQLKGGKNSDGISFITYPDKTAAELALKQLTAERYLPGIEYIKPIFNEAAF